MKVVREQIFPILLTFLTFIFLSIALFFIISSLNRTTAQDIILKLKISDIVVGLVIYLKTSFDFAIFISGVMINNSGFKKRIAIEIGTALGNGLGTILILIVWVFFKEVPALLAIMIFIASLVLIQMAQEGFEEFLEINKNSRYLDIVSFLNAQISKINKLSSPLLSKIIPSKKIKNTKTLPFFTLLIFSISVPFILGLDDFAGYIPVFSIVNVFGFSVGVFLGHMILNALLFVSPEKTIKISRNSLVLIIGSGAFIFIAIYGFIEIFKILL